jgi:MtN3 and saliva related transmembrane protein
MEYTGFIAGFLTTCCFIPQAVQTIKTRDTKGISLGMYVLWCLGVVLWLTYALLVEDMAQIATQTATLFFSSIILFIKSVNVIKGEK